MTNHGVGGNIFGINVEIYLWIEYWNEILESGKKLRFFVEKKNNKNGVQKPKPLELIA